MNNGLRRSEAHTYENAEKLDREILSTLPDVVAVLPADEVCRHLSQPQPLLV